jgi:phosphoglycerate-specific signal transduction histidine kinase
MLRSLNQQALLFNLNAAVEESPLISCLTELLRAENLFNRNGKQVASVIGFQAHENTLLNPS